MKRPGAKRLLVEGVWLAAALIGLCAMQRDGFAQSRGTSLGQKAPDFHITGIWGEPYSLEKLNKAPMGIIGWPMRNAT
jgi:hypothetical protein